jgi:hypothetical protein
MSDIQIPQLVAGVWEIEKQTLSEFIQPFTERTATFEQSVSLVEELYAYIQTLPAEFFRVHPQLKTALVDKAVEFLDNPYLGHMYPLLNATIQRLQ